jgi:hypothetical protein
MVHQYQLKNEFLAKNKHLFYYLNNKSNTCITQISKGLTSIRPNSVVIRNKPCCGTI